MTSSDSLVAHWDCLFTAVCERMRADAVAVSVRRDPDAAGGATDPALARLCDTVLDGVSALEQLHAARSRVIERSEPCGRPCCVRCRTDATDGPT